MNIEYDSFHATGVPLAIPHSQQQLIAIIDINVIYINMQIFSVVHNQGLNLF
jgi:hypothetical protein